MNSNLFCIFRDRFPKRKTRFIDIPSGKTVFYSDIDPMTARFAGALRTLGLQPGERLMMLVDKSPEAILLYLTALRMGAILVPLNTAYTTREFQYFLADATPKVVVLRPIVDLETRFS